ncbi:OmpL47-type beta-barrel domain-containing protein [Rummeliibacillus pycnus]|uniref:OmpL47-type beta-barrel domain-containing protein n=1 Tax=Rummeliibacillus pycnus TaxID=101070 RepID=UPI003D2CC0A2
MIGRKRKFGSMIAILFLLIQLVSPLGNAFAADSGVLLPPSNLAYKATTPDDGNLVWSSVYGATGYNVYEITDGQLILLGKATTNSYSLNNLSEGTHSYVVSTLSTYGESGPCAPVDVTVSYPTMVAPTSLTNTIQNGNDIVLNWGASSHAENYKVYQLAQNGTKKLLTTTTSRSYTIVNANEGTYTYVVSAVNSLYGESTTSTPIDVNVVYPVMKGPTNLTFILTNGSDINLKWIAATYANSYKIYQVINGQEVYQKSVTSTSAQFTNMSQGDYEYRVYSVSDRFGQSGTAASISLNVSNVSMLPPSNAVSTIKNLNDIVLSWASASYADSYNVYQIIDGQRVLKSTVTSTTATFTNMPAGDYTYEITSNSSRFGESEVGSDVSLTLDPVIMEKPDRFNYQINNGNDISLTWQPAANATNYRIYQIVNGQKVLKSTVTGTSISYTNMPAGDYSYQVYSFNSRFGESAEGASLSFPLILPTMVAPANQVSNITSPTSFSISWDASPYATSYKVYQIVNGTKTLKNTVSGTSINYTSMPAGQYQYEIHSYSSRFGESSDGSSVSLNLTGQAMGTPTNLAYTISNGNDIKLTWSPVQYATNYKIYKVVAGFKILQSTVTGTSVTYTNQPAGDYDYIVDSYSLLLGESPQGAEAQFTLAWPTMTAPTNLSGTTPNISDIALKWDSVPYATSYKVYEIIDGQEVFQRTVTTAYTTFSKVTEGTHTYVVHSYSSRFGESERGSSASFTITFPKVQAPNNLTYSIANGNDITLKWNAATYGTSYSIYQNVDGQLKYLKTVTGTSTTLVNMPEGDYTYEVHTISDRFGETTNGSVVSLSIVFSTMQAPLSLTKNITNGNDIVLSWPSATYATAYNIYQRIDGQLLLIKTVTGTSLTLANMPEGDYQYEVHSYSSRFGESENGSDVSFTLVFPIMQAPVATYSIVNGNDITLKWNATSYATGYNIYQIIDGQEVLKKTVTGTSTTFTNMPEGNYIYVVHSYSSRFGESPIGGTVSFNLDWPIVQAPALQGTIFNANNVTFSWNSVSWANEYHLYELKGDTKVLLYKGTSSSYTAYNLSEEPHLYQVTAYSTRFGESGLSNLVSENIIYPDMQAPIATLRVTGPASAVISWNFVTYANGYNIYELVDGIPVLLANNINNLSYTLSNLSYKNHEYYVTSSSNSFGESGPSNSVIAKLITDTLPPVTTADAASNWTKESQTVKLTATDNESGVAKTYYSINGSDYVEGTSFTVEQEGINEVSFYSIDKAGNKEDVKTVEVKVDKTAPETKADVPTEWVNKNVKVNLLATDSESGVAKTYYSINGSGYVEGTSFTVEQEEINNVSFYSIDKAGNKEDVKTVEVKVDKTAPETKADAPTEWVNKNVKVNLSATDSESGIAKTYYSINGSDYVEGTSFTVEREGINEVSFYSIDKAGNKEDVKKVEVKVDKTAPVITTNFNDYYKLGSTFQLDYETQDYLSGVAIEKVLFTAPNDPLGKVVNSLNQIILNKPGEYTVTIFATDYAGNLQIMKKTFTVFIPASIEVTPNVIKPNTGVFTLRVDLPEGFQANQFDLDTAQLNGVKALSSNNGYYNQAKQGQFKFERSNFTWAAGEQALEFRCNVNGYLVIGQTVVKVLN